MNVANVTASGCSDPVVVWQQAKPLERNGEAARRIAQQLARPFEKLPWLPGLGEHPAIAAPELGRACAAILGALAAPNGELAGVVAWLLDRDALAVPRCIGRTHGAAVPLTGPGVSHDAAVLLVGLRAALRRAVRDRVAQIWLVPTPAHLATVALPERLRRIELVEPAGDPSFADAVFVQRALSRLAEEGRRVHLAGSGRAG
jgi:hypothetical protein